MKRYGNLFEKICDYDNIKLAHKKAKKDKSFYREVKMVDDNEDYYIQKIQQMLINKTYIIKPTDYQMFKKIDKGKEREIFKLDYFPHRIIQHALMNVIQPILLNSFISNTFASIPKRGIHQALTKLKHDLSTDKEGTEYCLKMDVKKFYPNINQNICKALFRKKFKDDDVLWLVDVIVDSMEGDKGIAIGSLFSQWAGNYYLSYFDHWLKENKGVKYYYRYCDDLVILHHDKKFLHKLKREIDAYLNDNLDLYIKNTWQVFPSRVRGIDFIGYRMFDDYTLLRKTTSKNMIKKLTRIRKKCEKGGELTYGEWCTINSFSGWTKWCNGYNLEKKYVKPLENYATEYYNTKVKKNKDVTHVIEKSSWELFLDKVDEIIETGRIIKENEKKSPIDLKNIFGVVVSHGTT